jgi:hypothetical protein
VGAFTKEIIRILEAADATGPLADDVQRAIVTAGDLLAKVRSPHYHSGDANVDAEEIDEEEARQLKATLSSLLQRSPEPQNVTGVIWALGKSGDHQYVEEIVAQLRRGLELLLDGNKLVFQALCSLDDLGEDVVERDQDGGWSQTIDEVGKNTREARAFLEKRGIVLPW